MSDEAAQTPPSGVPQVYTGKFKPGYDPRRTGTSALAKEVRELAKAAAPAAIQRLIFLVTNGSAAVQVQAAKAVLGIAGVPLQPSLSVRHSHEASPGLAAAGMSIRELVLLVRESKSLEASGPPGAMPREPLPPVTAPALPQAGAVEAEYREIIGEKSGSASYDARGGACSSGSQPEAPGATEAESQGKSDV